MDARQRSSLADAAGFHSRLSPLFPMLKGLVVRLQTHAVGVAEVGRVQTFAKGLNSHEFSDSEGLSSQEFSYDRCMG